MLHRFAVPLALFAAFSTTAVQAAAPSLGGVTPRGGQRGTELEVTFSGGRLQDAQEVLFYESGIEVTKFEVVNDGAVKATLKIAADCVPGPHRLRLRTATGLSDLRSFMVGTLAQIDEVEPNSEFSAPQAISNNSTVNGVVQNEDVDYFVIEAKKGERITAEVEAIRLGISLFDVYVAIMNAARFEMSSSDDNPLVWQDGIASIIAPEDGKYIVQVRDSAYGGNGNCLYRLHVGNFPRPLATIPAGGKAGEQLTVLVLGDVEGPKQQTIQLPAQPTDLFSLFTNDDRGVSPSANPLRVSEFGNVVEQEPNETHDNATRFTAPIALNGVLESATDVDFFRFTAKKGEVYDVRVHARSLRSPLDPILTIFGANGGGIAANDDSAGSDSFLRFTVPSDGDFVVNVTDHLGQGGAEYAYRVEFSPVRPQLKMSLQEFVQYVTPIVTVPKGNRFAVMVNASRIDFGGALDIRAENLPAGVTIETPGMAANMTTVPVIFTATAEAANSVALSDLLGSMNDANGTKIVEGRVTQDVVMVRGQNQTPFYTETVDRLAVAVTNEVPFTLSIVEPKVPLVQGGQMDLKVVATRKEGFTAPIKIDLLYFPPGVNASRSISIAEGQTEAVIPVNAAGNARGGGGSGRKRRFRQRTAEATPTEPVEWQIAVTGQATVGDGPIMVSSPFASLWVADQYVTFAYENAAVEQGKETELVVKVTKGQDFEGTAKATLVGLPNKAVTVPIEFTKDTTELIFKIKTEMDTPAGNHKNLFCQVIITEEGEPILHNLGTGALRVDVPLPPKKDEPAPMPTPAATPTPAPKPAEPTAAPPKRLTRLEQLRLEQAEREKAEKEKAAAGGQ